MRKARKKAVSVIVALTFLLGLVFAYTGSAIANPGYGTYSGAYAYVEVGTNQAAGYAQVTEDSTNTWSNTVYVTVTLPTGVTYNAEPSALADYVQYTGAGSAEFYDGSKNSLTVKVTPGAGSDVVQFKFNVSNKSSLDIASGVSGDIKATIELMQVGASGIEWVESGTVTIAKVATKSVTISADTPKIIQVGSGKDGADITIREGTAASLQQNEWVYVRIDTTDVKFASDFDTSTVVATGLTIGNISSAANANNFKFQVTAPSSALPGKVTIKLAGKLNVPPSVSGDIKITIYGDSGSKIPQTTVTVATIGTAAVNVTDVKNTGGTVYAGYAAGQEVKASGKAAEFKLKTTSGNIPTGKIVVLELTAGKFDTTNKFKLYDKDGNNVTGTFTINFYNSDKSAWFEIPASYTNQPELKISNIYVVVPGDTAAGDLKVKVSGTLGASGEVALGKVDKPFTVKASAVPEIPYPSQDQAAGDLVITEAAAGAITTDGTDELRVKLPANINFRETPTVKVTSGDLKLGTAELVNGELKIPVQAKSVLPSVITISGIKYDVTRLALEGNVEVEVYGNGNSWDEKTIVKVANAKVVAPAPPTKREASFVIGSTTYKVNGKDYTMDVAPYIDAASGRTFVPVRYVAYALGVSEDNIFYSNGVVSLLKDGRAVQMTIGSKALVVNGVTITMDAAPVIKDGRTMLPYRWIATALGASVKWDEATKTVTVNIE